MKFVEFFAFSIFVSVVRAFHIVPPSSIVACEPLTVEYDTVTGIPPYSLSFHTGSESGPIAAAFTNVAGSSFTWDLVTIPAGTPLVIVLGDAIGLGSYTPVITVSAGSTDICLDNPTSIPSIPTVTSTTPPTSTFNSSSILPSSTTNTSMSTPTPPISSSSLSSVVSSASSESSSSTSTPRPSSTGGLSTSGGIVNAADIFGIGVITAVCGALLA